jgi:hypothetical protein
MNPQQQSEESNLVQSDRDLLVQHIPSVASYDSQELPHKYGSITQHVIKVYDRKNKQIQKDVIYLNQTTPT